MACYDAADLGTDPQPSDSRWKCVRRAARYAVFDDVLPPDEFARVWEYIQLEDYGTAHHNRWEKVWRLTDGQPLVGSVVRWPEDAARGAPATYSDGRPIRTYPTRGGIDCLVRLLLERHEEFAEWIGYRERDWRSLTARPYLYPAGTALSWHTDDIFYSGAFVYYAHPVWSASWGGELMIADEATSDTDLGEKYAVAAVMDEGRVVGLRRTPVPAALDHGRENAVLTATGLGEFVLAEPNRLVITKRGTPHRVARVDPAAGENVRCSIAGFFLSDVKP